MMPFRGYKPSAQELYEALQREEDRAITYLSRQIEGKIVADCQQYGLENESNEVLNDVLWVFMNQIRLKKYVYEKAQPHTYALACAKYVLSDWVRKKKRHAKTEDTADYTDIKDTYHFAKMLESSDNVARWFEVLRQKQKKTDVCADLIHLYHVQGFSYEDILKNNLIPLYNDVGSLKSKKSACVQIFREIIRNLS
jgi:DNA-directed RNA polymerase specialized sigma24 family protein